MNGRISIDQSPDRYELEERQSDPDREQRILQRLQRNIAKNKSTKLKHEQIVQEQVPDPVDSSVENDEKSTEIEGMPPTTDDGMEVDEPVTAKQNLLNRDVGDDFMILGDNDFQRKQKIDAMLPSWLSHPTVISRNLSEMSTPIADVTYISPEIKECLTAMGIKHLFPVQEAVIPWILNVNAKPLPFRPRDVCVSAPTGSGKTLAYALPIVEYLSSTRVDRKVRALIVLPVNELAVQVLKIVQKLCEKTNLKCTLLSKFTPFDVEQSQLVEFFDDKYYSRVDIVIATTGRLVEHIHATKGFSLKSLKFLVMDEADRIMEQIQNNWLYHLDEHVKEQSDSFLSGRSMPLCYDELSNEASRQPHKLLFSATLSQDPEKLQSLKLFEPKLFTSIVKPFVPVAADDNETPSTTTVIAEQRGEFIGKYTTPAELTEKYCMTEARIRPLTLFTLIKENNWNRFLCFTNSGESAHRLSYVLQNLLGTEMKIEELSSGLSPAVRNSVLLRFQNGQIDGIICSDALARGIDIANVDIVISYEAPRHVKTYIHRIGRTARAGRPGTAVTILTKSELNAFKVLTFTFLVHFTMSAVC